jgi:TonB family protein
MKRLNFALSVLFLVCVYSSAARSQGTKAWVNVAPSGEEFTVQMPQTPATATQKRGYGDLEVEGRVYTAVDGDSTYQVWSLKNTKFTSVPKDYLDLCADLVWESLLRPVRDKLPKEAYVYAHMDYVGATSGGGLGGREYLLKLDKAIGVTNFFVDHERIYVLTVLNAGRDAPETDRFLKSFSVTKPAAPEILKVPVPLDSSGTGTGTGAGVGPGEPQGQNSSVVATPAAATDDPNRIFSGRDVTERARIVSKPQATYTDSARKYRVQGTVTMRAVLSKDGEVTNISVIRWLPHGLTDKAIAAARGIKFEPAVNDGRKVSQYILLEYNFNLY